MVYIVKYIALYTMRFINSPMFCLIEGTVSYSINEYTLRALQIDIAKGLIPFDQYYIYEAGRVVIFDNKGNLSAELIGLDIADKLALDLFLLNRQK